MRTMLMALGLSAGLAGAGGAADAAEAPTGGAWTDCTVTSITAFRDYLLLSCAPPPGDGLQGAGAGPGTIREFGIESMSPLTDPVLRLAMSAKSGGRTLGILFVKDPEANPPGCARDRCRRIAGVELK